MDLKDTRFIINLRMNEGDYPVQSMCTDHPERLTEELVNLFNNPQFWYRSYYNNRSKIFRKNKGSRVRSKHSEFGK